MSAEFGNELAGDALNAFMAWCQANPSLNFVQAKVGYFDRLLVDANLARAELTSARTELERLRGQLADVRAAAKEQVRAAREAAATPTIKEESMPATFDDGAAVDPMITAAAEAIEEAMVPRIGRDLGTIHRDPIVAACVSAALRVMADEIEVEPSFPMTAGLAAEAIRERADRIGGSDG